ncbi:MAG: rRNA maturation RNase YbeY [Sphaerochaetaceae bacterium]|nr:rRNA maturation RNase YbeY [Sphaerochaetaceae bacterium]
MFDLFYDSEDFKKDAPEQVVEKFLAKCAPLAGVDGSFSLTFVSPETIKELNRDYRNKDEVTDILTFALEDDDEFPDFSFQEDAPEKEYGDVFICLERMKENANTFGVSEREELLRLCLHGLLHLAGNDHKTNDFATEPMLIRQEEILNILKGSFIS